MNDNIVSQTLYEPLASLIERHKETLAITIVEQAIAADLIFAAVMSPTRKARMVENFVGTLEVMAQYVLSGDTTVWRDYIGKLGKALFREKIQSVETMQLTTAIITQNSKRLVEQEWPGPAHERTRQRYFRRLDGIDMLTNNTILATGLKSDHDKAGH